MENEINTLTYENTKVTFTGKANNIETSDELTAAPLYQDKMGTTYSKSKAVIRVFNFTGISLILTAAAIKTGTLIANAYVLNPPSLSNVNYVVEGNKFSASFTVSNPRNYATNYYLYINDIEVLNGDCSEEKEYTVNYDKLKVNDKCRFYVEFTNSVDYKQKIESHTFTVEE